MKLSEKDIKSQEDSKKNNTNSKDARTSKSEESSPKNGQSKEASVEKNLGKDISKDDNPKNENPKNEIYENEGSDPEDKSDKDEPEKKRPVEDNLENYTRNPFKRMKRERARMAEQMADMTTSGKIKYIFYYYKWYMLVTLLAIFFIFYLIDVIYKNSRPVALSYVIVNSFDIEGIYNKVDPILEYADYYGIRENHKIDAVTDITLKEKAFDENNQNSELDNYRYVSFSNGCGNDYFDVIFADEEGLRVCSFAAHAHPVKDILTPENYERCEKENRLVTQKGFEGEPDYYGVDISDLPAAKAMNLRYSKIYLCFPGDSESNIKNANNFLAFILQK